MPSWIDLLRSCKFSGPVVLLCVLTGVLLGTGGYTLTTSGATAYLRDDPVACVNCHIMRDQYDGWQKASHHAQATCNDCHVPVDFLGKYWTKAEEGYRHSKGFTFQDFHEPIRIRSGGARIVRANCLRCHADLMHDVASPSDPEPKRVDCVRCHSQVGHGSTR